jgi:hypothetical protein
MPAHRSAAVLAMLALAAAAAGCGRSDEEKVRDTLRRFERAAQRGDYQELCDDVLARQLLERLQRIGLPCRLALQRGLGAVRRPRLRVSRVKVRGDVALAQVTTTAVGQRPSRDTVRLVKQGDDWKISALSGAQPPAPPRGPAGQDEHE